MNTGEIIKEMRRHYDNLINFHMSYMPVYARNKIKHHRPAQALAYCLILRACIFLVNLLGLKPPPKYTFQGLRHMHLIKILPPSAVMIIGGRNEYSYCRRMGYKFHWAGYMNKCFELYYFANKFALLKAAISFGQKFFTPTPGETNYLFLWEDTQPIGIFLSVGLRDVSELNIICIAHGYDYAANSKRSIYDGERCKFNFVYDAAQRDLLSRHVDKSTIFELGLPYEVAVAPRTQLKVVLVEHTGIDAGPEFIITTAHFIKVYRILTRAGVNVVYRIRPGSDETLARGLFADVYSGDKLDLFAEGRMIFIGFNSTLLFEASVFGNAVVGLDTSDLFDSRNFAVDAVISCAEYDELPRLLYALLTTKFDSEVFPPEKSLLSRLNGCLELVTKYNKRRILESNPASKNISKTLT